MSVRWSRFYRDGQRMEKTAVMLHNKSKEQAIKAINFWTETVLSDSHKIIFYKYLRNEHILLTVIYNYVWLWTINSIT